MEIKKARKRIDEINHDMLRLFVERMDLSQDIAKYKSDNSLPLTDMARERAILSDIEAESPRYSEYSKLLFQRLFELSKASQSETLCKRSGVEDAISKALASNDQALPESGSVACQGIAGAYSSEAQKIMLPSGAPTFFGSFEETARAVAGGSCEYGVLPVENSIFGSVRNIYRLLLGTGCKIVCETELEIRHELMALPGASLDSITEILSHEQALGQCAGFLSTLGSRVKATPSANTAIAAKTVRDSKRLDLASISSPKCAELYGLQTLKRDISDLKSNHTRFVLIKKELAIYEGASKISLILSCRDEPGALANMLGAISARGVNVSKLESFPARGDGFAYMFFVVLDASVRDAGVVSLLSWLERECGGFALLGCHPVV